MDNKYIDFVARGLAIGAFTLLMLALSSGGMFFIENLSIQFFGEEPSPEVNLWVIGLSTIAFLVFLLYAIWADSRERAKANESKPTEEGKQIDQLTIGDLQPAPWVPGEEVNEIVLDNVGEVPLDEMEDGERILYKCFRHELDGRHVFYRVLVKITDENGPVLKDENDTDMEWIQEDTKCFGAWGFFDVRDITNYDDGSKDEGLPY